MFINDYGDSGVRNDEYRSALSDFQYARNLGALQQILSKITGRSTDLLSFDEISRKLRIVGGSDRGLKSIPIDAIVGSVGRYSDFTRGFFPRQSSDIARWARVKALMSDLTHGSLPPIEVYKIGEAYFVKEGQHRVSAARRLKFTHIDAHVIEVRTKVSLTADVTPDELIIKSEYVDFLERTHIDEILPDVDFTVTVPGQYERLEEHIRVHRYFMGLDLKRDISWEEAVKHWYDEVYFPVIQSIRERGILRQFPGRTETDLGLWVSEHRHYLEKELGWQIRPGVAATDLMYRNSPKVRFMFQRIINRLLDRLIPDELESSREPGYWLKDKGSNLQNIFSDILTPISGEEVGWAALDEAIIIAQRENARIHGLHILPEKTSQDMPEVLSVAERFDQTCLQAGIGGNLAYGEGEIARVIVERALLTDLVVMNLAHPPDSQIFARLGSGFRTIIRRIARPVMAIPGRVTELDSAVIAFDGSPKAKEALFISAYFSQKWKMSITVLVVEENGKDYSAVVHFARQYLEKRNISVDYIERVGDVGETILQVVQEKNAQLIIMGGYGYRPVMEMVLGSSVDLVLQRSQVPVLICQ